MRFYVKSNYDNGYKHPVIWFILPGWRYNTYAMHEVIENKIEAFFSKFRLKNYPEGQILILNGETTEYIYQLVKGRVKQYDVTYRGDEVIVNTFKPPAFFPMSLVINKGENPYIFEAETDIAVRQVPVGEVIAFIKDNPDVLFDLLSRVYRGVDGLLARMSHLMASSAKERLVYELLIECRRFGEQQSDGSFIIKINEKSLGAKAGLSRETVSRELNKLVRADIVTFRPGEVTVKNVPILEKQLDKTV